MTYVLFNIKRYNINIIFWVFWVIIALYPMATIMGILSIDTDIIPLEKYQQLNAYKGMANMWSWNKWDLPLQHDCLHSIFDCPHS